MTTENFEQRLADLEHGLWMARCNLMAHEHAISALIVALQSGDPSDAPRILNGLADVQRNQGPERETVAIMTEGLADQLLALLRGLDE